MANNNECTWLTYVFFFYPYVYMFSSVNIRRVTVGSEVILCRNGVMACAKNSLGEIESCHIGRYVARYSMLRIL